MPAVVVATEPFRQLLKVTLRARGAPEALAVVLKGNPERLDPEALAVLADKALDAAVRRLTAGSGDIDELLE
jgi:hypothetical protein